MIDLGKLQVPEVPTYVAPDSEHPHARVILEFRSNLHTAQLSGTIQDIDDAIATLAMLRTQAVEEIESDPTLAPLTDIRRPSAFRFEEPTGMAVGL